MEEEREEGGNLEDFPVLHGRVAVLASTETLSRRRIVDREILAKPLLHEDAKRRRRETEEETREPQDVDADGPDRRLEGRKLGGGVGRVHVAGSGSEILRDELLQQAHNDVLGVLLQMRVRLDDERCQYGGVQTGLLRGKRMSRLRTRENISRTKTRSVSISSLQSSTLLMSVVLTCLCRSPQPDVAGSEVWAG